MEKGEEDVKEKEKTYRYSAKAFVSLAKNLLPQFSFSGYIISTNNLPDFLGTEMSYLFLLDFLMVFCPRVKKALPPTPALLNMT